MKKKCEICGRKAEYVDSVPDSRVEGYSRSECGYRSQYLCTVHAFDRRKTNTSRVEPIE